MPPSYQAPEQNNKQVYLQVSSQRKPISLSTTPSHCWERIIKSNTDFHGKTPSLSPFPSSEPRFLANVQRYFADFPYFPSLLDQRLFTLETCCGNQYDCLGKNKHQLVFYDTIIHFNLSREGQTQNNLKRQIILQDRFLLRQMTYFQRRPKNSFKKKRQLFSNEQQYSRAYLLSPVVLFFQFITKPKKEHSQRQFQNINWILFYNTKKLFMGNVSQTEVYFHLSHTPPIFDYKNFINCLKSTHPEPNTVAREPCSCRRS